MPGEELKKSRVDLLGEEVFRVTSFPAVLIQLVKSYFVLDDSVSLNSLLLLLDQANHTDCDRKPFKADWADVSFADRFAAIRKEGMPSWKIEFSGANAVFGEVSEKENKWDTTLSAKEMWNNLALQKHIWEERTSRSDFRSFPFNSSQLPGAKFEGVMCKKLEFCGAQMPGASFKYSILADADFGDADLRGANLSFACGAKYTYIGSPHFRAVAINPNNESVNFTSDYKEMFPNFSSTELSFASLYRSDFSYVEFAGTSFSHGNLTQAIFLKAKFKKCSMKEADLRLSNFSFSHFSNCNLSGVNATQADFHNAYFSGGSFSDAVLTEANLVGFNFFPDVKMSGARLDGAHFSLSQFTEAQVLSFHYENTDAVPYIKAIQKYMRENENLKNHQTGLERAKKLIMGFINQTEPGENKLLAGFLLTGSLPDELTCWGLFGTSDKSNPNSLCARLLAVRRQIEQEKLAAQEQKAVLVPKKPNNG